MIEDLSELYAAEKRHVELFELHLRYGDLRKALTVPFTEGFAAKVSQQRILQLVNYLGIECSWPKSESAAYGIASMFPEVLKTTAVADRIQQWDTGLSKRKVKAAEGQIWKHVHKDLMNTEVKRLLGLQVSQRSIPTILHTHVCRLFLTPIH